MNGMLGMTHYGTYVYHENLVNIYAVKIHVGTTFLLIYLMLLVCNYRSFVDILTHLGVF